jgi:protein phosphatase
MDQHTNPAPWHRAVWPLLPVTSFQPLSASMSVEIAAASHPGNLKRHNDDNFLVLHLGRDQRVVTTSLPEAELPADFAEHAYVMIVADGLGGPGAAALASRLALSTIAQLALHFGQWNLRVDEAVVEDVKKRMEFFYTRVSDTLIDRSLTDRGLSTMGTAMTAANSEGSDLFVAHIGHTRAYICREGHLIGVTKDDTFDAEGQPGLAQGFERDTATSDLGHILTNAIGGSFTDPAVDIQHCRLVHGDILLLCTNGLTDVVEEYRIGDTLNFRRNLDEQCRSLIDCALEAGGPDNVTVVLAQYAIPQP